MFIAGGDRWEAAKPLSAGLAQQAQTEWVQVPAGMSKPPADLGVGHCDRRAKAQLRDERPRYTVSRDTHHRLLSGFAQALSRGGGIVQSATEGQTVRLSPALFQPMASDATRAR